MPNYQESIIYKLCCKDTTIADIYIGSTTNFRRRKTQHKFCCLNETSEHYLQPKYIFIRINGGWDNWDMIQIKKVSCNSKRELEAEERKVYDELKPALNFCKPQRKDGDLKIYVEENKEKIKQYQKTHTDTGKRKERTKIYRDENKEKIKQSKKEYALKNKEKIKQYHKEYYQNKKLNIIPN